MVLAVGNSRLQIGVFSSGNLEFVERIPLEPRSDWPKKIADAWQRIDGLASPAVVGCSVNPPLIESLEHVVQEKCNRAIQWVGPDLDLPIGVETREPKETGVDRVLGVAAAYEQIGKACVVVDAGTAITINCCNDNGDFLGGAIAPGVSMMLDVLHEKTARLPRVQFQPPTEALGNSTESAIRQGVYHALRGLVREFVENYAAHLGSWPEVIVTGGDAKVLFENWEIIHAISPDLLLYGVALSYANHHIRHDS